MAVELLLFRAEACEACDRQRDVFWRVRREAAPGMSFLELRMTREPLPPEVAQLRVSAHPTTLLRVGNLEVARWEGEVGRKPLLDALRAAGV